MRRDVLHAIGGDRIPELPSRLPSQPRLHLDHRGAVRSPDQSERVGLHAGDASRVPVRLLGDQVKRFRPVAVRLPFRLIANRGRDRNGGYPNSPLIGKYCGTQLSGQVIPSHSNRLWVHLVTDRSFSARGFRIYWDSSSTGLSFCRSEGLLGGFCRSSIRVFGFSNDANDE